MPMKHISNFVTGGVWIGRATVLALLVGFLAACQENNPEVIAPVSPTPDVAVSPTTPPPSPPSVVVSPTAPASPAPTGDTATAPITDVVVVATTPDRQSLVDRQVQLTSVPVQSVVGDRTFWVGPSNNQRLLVVLEEELDTGTTERALNVNAGQTLTMSGVIRPLPSVEEAQKQWGLSAAEAQALQNEQVYLQASQVTVK